MANVVNDNLQNSKSFQLFRWGVLILVYYGGLAGTLLWMYLLQFPWYAFVSLIGAIYAVHFLHESGGWPRLRDLPGLFKAKRSS